MARTSSSTASPSAMPPQMPSRAPGCTPTTFTPTCPVRWSTATTPRRIWLRCPRRPRRPLWASAARTAALPSATRSGSSPPSAVSTTSPRRWSPITRTSSPAASRVCTPSPIRLAAARPATTMPRPASCWLRWSATRTPLRSSCSIWAARTCSTTSSSKSWASMTTTASSS